MSIPNCRSTWTHRCCMLVLRCLSFVPFVASSHCHCGRIIISHCQSTTVHRCDGIIIPRCRRTAMYRCSMLRGLAFVVIYWHCGGVKMFFIDWCGGTMIALICWYLYFVSFVVSGHCGCRRFILKKKILWKYMHLTKQHYVQKTWCLHPAMILTSVSL